jgi:hypothetical protein
VTTNQTSYSIFTAPTPGYTHKENLQQQQNELQNAHVGDILAKKPEHISRVYVQNQHGINIKNNGHQFKELCEDTRLIQADLRGIVEHNLDTTNAEVRRSCTDIAKQTFPHHILEMTSSSIAYKTPYKPGGTMILATEGITGRVTQQTSDTLGRWTYLQMAGRNGRILNFITAYQVCA